MNQETMEINKLVVASSQGYRVDKDGSVIFPGKQKKLTNTNGYLLFSINSSKKALRIYLHRLQAYQKYGDSIFEDGIEVRHLNGNSLDNSYDNISIGTHTDNMRDKSPYVRKNVRRNNLTKYGIDEIDEWKRLSNLGFCYTDISQITGVNTRTITRILGPQKEVHKENKKVWFNC